VERDWERDNGIETENRKHETFGERVEFDEKDFDNPPTKQENTGEIDNGNFDESGFGEGAESYVEKQVQAQHGTANFNETDFNNTSPRQGNTEEIDNGHFDQRAGNQVKRREGEVGDTKKDFEPHLNLQTDEYKEEDPKANLDIEETIEEKGEAILQGIAPFLNFNTERFKEEASTEEKPITKREVILEEEKEKREAISQAGEGKGGAMWQGLTSFLNEATDGHEEESLESNLKIDRELEEKHEAIWKELEPILNKETDGREEEPLGSNLKIDRELEEKHEAIWKELEPILNKETDGREEKLFGPNLKIDRELEEKHEAIWKELEPILNKETDGREEEPLGSNLKIDRELEEKREAIWKELEPFLNEGEHEHKKESFEVNPEKSGKDSIYTKLDESRWKDVEEREKKELLIEYLKHECNRNNLDNIPQIRFEELEEDTFGLYKYIENNTYKNEIVLNTRYLDDSRICVNTIAHEVCHAYQFEQIEKYYNGEDLNNLDPRTKEWVENYEKGYIKYEDDPYGYRYQPLEKVAFDYGDIREKEVLFDYSRLEENEWRKLEGIEKIERLTEYFKHECQLNDLENPPRIKFEYFDSPEQRTWGGYHCYENNEIVINTRYLNNVRDCVNTIAHEVHHAYQHRQMDKYYDGEDLRKLDPRTLAWVYNEKTGYITPKEDPIGYRNQPQEKDAFDYGKTREEEIFGPTLWTKLKRFMSMENRRREH
jgi:uncharacterized protein YjaZ